VKWAFRGSLGSGCCAVLLGAAFVPIACVDESDSCDATHSCPSGTAGTASGGTSGSSAGGMGGTAGGASGSAGSMAGSGANTGGASGTTGDDSGADSSLGDGGGAGNADGSAGSPDVGSDSFDTIVRGVVTTPAGAPMSGITVVIGSTVTTTDSQGEFAIANVPPTYDLTIVRFAEPVQKFAELYVKLTTRRPIIVPMDVTDPPFPRWGTASVTVEPPEAFPLGASQLRMAFHPANVPPAEPHVLGSTTFSGSFYWVGNETLSGQLYALQWSLAASGLPSGYLRWGTQPITLMDQRFTSTTLRLSAATQQETAGTVRSPQPINTLTANLWAGAIHVFVHDFPGQPSPTEIPFRFLVPTGMGVVPKTARFNAFVPGGGSTTSVQLKDSMTTLNVDLMSPPKAERPVDAASGIDTNTNFVWSAVPNAVYTLLVHSGAAGPGTSATTFRVHTTATVAKVPDTLARGVPFATGSYQWVVFARGPARATDDLVKGTGAVEQQDVSFANHSDIRRLVASGP
jgi:hypothetical protein